MVDIYGREISYLRLSVTDRCNLRCRYCMPADGICKKSHAEMLTEDEMVRAVEAAASLGIRKLRLTGGEPLVKKNILSICERCAAVEGIREVCLTTNGTLLPQMAKDLKAAGVERLNISLDTLDPEKYAYITRVGTLKQALRGIDCALEAGFAHLKINAVLIGGFNDDEIPALAELTRRYPADVRFIELMPMTEQEQFGQNAYVPTSAVLDALPELEAAGEDGVARLYRLPNAGGNIGLISAVSSHFCAACNRIRLTADGKLKPCLHSDAEYSVKGLDLEGMRREMERAILAKPACHAPLSSVERSNAGRNMNQIGG
ncbi:MAG: GTP 3',8-cyclase MoaA [Oscillospiraceae bacterium]|nr:GTP 3',8-cyclase MoaA [Oscillospiraceae bacterium]